MEETKNKYKNGESKGPPQHSAGALTIKTASTKKKSASKNKSRFQSSALRSIQNGVAKQREERKGTFSTPFTSLLVAADIKYGT
jgi:hypothetical protein